MSCLLYTLNFRSSHPFLYLVLSLGLWVLVMEQLKRDKVAVTLHVKNKTWQKEGRGRRKKIVSFLPPGKQGWS